MGSSSRFGLGPKHRDSYLECVIEFPLASIRNEAHLSAAQKRIDELLARPALEDGEHLYLDALSDLVETYEETHHPIAAASDADMLRHLLDAKGISQSQLGRDCGIPRSTVSEILSGKRRFSRQLIGKLAAYFKVDAGILMAGIE